MFKTTGVAISVYCVAIILSGSLATSLGKSAAKILPWVDLHTAMAPLYQDWLTPTQLTQLAVAALIWVAIPMALGLVRNVADEVKS